MLHVSCWQFHCQSAETAPDFRQPNDWRKRWDLVSHRNVNSEEAALVCGGRLFHARTAAIGKKHAAAGGVHYTRVCCFQPYELDVYTHLAYARRWHHREEIWHPSAGESIVFLMLCLLLILLLTCFSPNLLHAGRMSRWDAVFIGTLQLLPRQKTGEKLGQRIIHGSMKFYITGEFQTRGARYTWEWLYSMLYGESWMTKAKIEKSWAKWNR